MLLYLSSNRNINLLDFLKEEKEFIIKKLAGEFNLKKFIIEDMKSLSHYTNVVIDLSSLIDIENEIIEGILAFLKMYDSRLILLAEGLERDNPFLIELLENQIYNIITAKTVDKIKEEIRTCLSIEGVTYQYWNNNSENRRYIFKGNKVQIAIAGSMTRVGTTTTAINMASFLASIGAKVCYIEINKHNHLRSLPLVYKGMKKQEEHLEYKGVTYYFIDADINNINNINYDFIIYDTGVLTAKTAGILNKSTVSILCASTNPYELQNLHEAYELKDTKATILIPFVLERNRDSIRELLRNLIEDNIHFLDYSPELFDASNKDVFLEVLKEYVEEKEK